MYIFHGWGTSNAFKKKKACLILLVLQLEMSLLMIYLSYLSNYDMKIILMVLAPNSSV